MILDAVHLGYGSLKVLCVSCLEITLCLPVLEAFSDTVRLKVTVLLGNGVHLAWNACIIRTPAVSNY